MISKKTYFNKIFILFLSILLLSSAIISAVFYSSLESAREAELQNRCEQNVSQFAAWNDIRINTAQVLVENLLVDKDVLNYVLLNDMNNFTRLSRKFGDYRNVFAQLGTDVGIIDMENKATVTLNSVNKIDLDRINLPEGLNEDLFMRSEDLQQHLIDGSVFNAISYYKKHSYSNGKELVFFYTLYDNAMFSGMSEGDTNGVYAIIQDNKAIYCSEPDENFNIFADTSPGTIKKGKYIAHKVASQRNYKIEYIYYVPNKYNHIFFLQLSVLILLLCAISFGASHLLARRLYSPIREILRNFRSLNNDSIDDDMEYLLRTAEKLSNNLSRLEEEKKQSQTILVEKFLSDLCNGALSENQIAAFIQKHGLSFLTKPHTPVSFVISNREELFENYGMDVMLYLKKDIMDSLRERLQDSLLYFFEDDYAGFTVLFPNRPNGEVEIIEDMIYWLKSEFDIRLNAYIGKIAEDYTHTEDSYQILQIVKNDRFAVRSNQYIYNAENYPESHDNKFHYTLEMEQQVIDLMLNGRFAAAKHILENIIDATLEQETNAQTVDRLKYGFEMTINRLMAYLGKNAEEVYEKHETIGLFTTDTGIESVKASLLSMFEPLEEHIPNLPSGNDDIEQIKKFIDENIKNNIGLDDLAGYLNYSSWHTSKIFKSMFNQNFKTYVNIRRVEIAKGLLLQGKKVHEVATETGCNHVETLIRIFKKHTGILPSEYVKRK